MATHLFRCFKMTEYISDMPKGRPSDAPRTEFGQRLVDLREKAGLTQSDVADHVGVSTRAYAFWERKPVALQVEQIAKLAGLFNVPADVIVGREAPKRRRNGPQGKLEKVFQTAASLPRSQQLKIIEMAEALIAKFESEHKAKA